MSRFRWLVFSLVIIGSLMLLSPLVSNYMGYCQFFDDRMSDEEAVDIVVRRALKFYPPVVDVYKLDGNQRKLVDRYRPDDYVKYEGIEEFYKANPGCCNVVEYTYNGDDPGVMAKIMGRFRGWVRLEYRVDFKSEGGELLSSMKRTHRAVANCGSVWSGI